MLAVKRTMALLAEPANLERLRVVLVMSLSVRLRAELAGRSLQPAAADLVPYRPPRALLLVRTTTPTQALSLRGDGQAVVLVPPSEPLFPRAVRVPGVGLQPAIAATRLEPITLRAVLVEGRAVLQLVARAAALPLFRLKP
jgi:hypothetical protein